jgi:hypothetical protein
MSVKSRIARCLLAIGFRRLAFRLMWKEICTPNWPRVEARDESEF